MFLSYPVLYGLILLKLSTKVPPLKYHLSRCALPCRAVSPPSAACGASAPSACRSARPCALCAPVPPVARPCRPPVRVRPSMIDRSAVSITDVSSCPRLSNNCTSRYCVQSAIFHTAFGLMAAQNGTLIFRRMLTARKNSFHISCL